MKHAIAAGVPRQRSSRAKLLVKRLLFPGTDVATRKRMALRRYFLAGDLLTLDAGCGNGAFSFAAARKGNRVVGISFREDEVTRCEAFRDYLGLDPERCRFVKHNIYDLERFGHRFDQIICFETLEHLASDQDVLRLFARILKPGGALHITTPRGDRTTYFGERLSEVEDGGHVRLGYTFSQLDSMLANAGFEVQRRERVVGAVSIGVMNLARRTARWFGAAPEAFQEVAAGAVTFAFWPLTWFDAVAGQHRSLCVYVHATLAAHSHPPTGTP